MVNVATYRWGSRTVKHHFCANCGCGTFSESSDWSTGMPDFENPRVGENSGARQSGLLKEPKGLTAQECLP
jgi:hypothetical protein